MGQLVVTFHPDGAVETLLKDKVLDTRILGDKRKIERVSEILPTADGLEFLIRWLKGPLVGNKQMVVHHNDGGGSSLFRTSNSVQCHSDGVTPIRLYTYEEAVELEVATVNALRLAGHSFI